MGFAGRNGGETGERQGIDARAAIWQVADQSQAYRTLLWRNQMNSQISVFLNRISHRVGAALAVAVLLLGAVAANASCRMPQSGARAQTQMPQLKVPANQG